MDQALYIGEVVHQRFAPKRHRLAYRVFQTLLDLDAPESLNRLRFFSRNRFNLFSFYDRDHGPDKADTLSPLRDRMTALLRRHGLYQAGDRLFLMAMPRVLGFVFNPISLYFAQAPDGSMRAVIYEVNNTFGDRHSYVLPVQISEPHIRQSSDKRLHVSPFMDMDMAYRFDLTAPGERFVLQIRLNRAETPMLFASFSAQRRALDDAQLLRLFFVMPFLTLKVVLGIHWEALLLFAKGLRLKPKPPTQKSSVSAAS